MKIFSLGCFHVVVPPMGPIWAEMILYASCRLPITICQEVIRIPSCSFFVQTKICFFCNVIIIFFEHWNLKSRAEESLIFVLPILEFKIDQGKAHNITNPEWSTNLARNSPSEKSRNLIQMKKHLPYILDSLILNFTFRKLGCSWLQKLIYWCLFCISSLIINRRGYHKIEPKLKNDANILILFQ